LTRPLRSNPKVMRDRGRRLLLPGGVFASVLPLVRSGSHDRGELKLSTESASALVHGRRLDQPAIKPSSQARRARP